MASLRLHGNVHRGFLLVLLLCLVQAPLGAFAQKADKVLVIKSEKRLYLMKDGKRVASYRATFGANPVGHKERQGDERTP